MNLSVIPKKRPPILSTPSSPVFNLILEAIISLIAHIRIKDKNLCQLSEKRFSYSRYISCVSNIYLRTVTRNKTLSNSIETCQLFVFHFQVCETLYPKPLIAVDCVKSREKADHPIDSRLDWAIRRIYKEHNFCQ